MASFLNATKSKKKLMNDQSFGKLNDALDTAIVEKDANRDSPLLLNKAKQGEKKASIHQAMSIYE